MMATRSLAMAAVVGLFLLGTVSGHHQRSHQTPHLCDADGESSEECQNRARNPVQNVLRAKMADLTVKFFLHKNINNPDESVELISGDIESIRRANPYPTPNAKWKILIPGFPSNGKSPFPNNVRDAYLQRMYNVPDEPYNILIVDWDRDTMCKLDTKITDSNLTYTAAVGEKVAEMLIFLNEQQILNLSKDTHIIAFSVGAHVAGETARFVFRRFENISSFIYRISALDPAGDNFWPREYLMNRFHPRPWDRESRIGRGFVGYLDVYHTSKEYGTGDDLGDIDFYINGGRKQPGCYRTTIINDFEDLCDHVYSTEIFAKSVNDKSMEGCTPCEYYDLYKSGKCECEETPVLGEFVDEKLIDGYPISAEKTFILTGDLENFGERFEKTLVEAGEPENSRRMWYQLC